MGAAPCLGDNASGSQRMTFGADFVKMTFIWLRASSSHSFLEAVDLKWVLNVAIFDSSQVVFLLLPDFCVNLLQTPRLFGYYQKSLAQNRVDGDTSERDSVHVAFS